MGVVSGVALVLKRAQLLIWDGDELVGMRDRPIRRERLVRRLLRQGHTPRLQHRPQLVRTQMTYWRHEALGCAGNVGLGWRRGLHHGVGMA